MTDLLQPVHNNRVAVLGHALSADPFPTPGNTPDNLCQCGAWFANNDIQAPLGIDALGLGFGLDFGLGFGVG